MWRLERKSNIPEGVKKEDWESFVELNSTSQAHSLRQKGKAARKAPKCPRTSGRKGQARVAAELSQQIPDGLVTRTQVYLATHGRKDGATGNQYLDYIKAPDWRFIADTVSAIGLFAMSLILAWKGFLLRPYKLSNGKVQMSLVMQWKLSNGALTTS